jgi:hypothetical protein
MSETLDRGEDDDGSHAGLLHYVLGQVVPDRGMRRTAVIDLSCVRILIILIFAPRRVTVSILCASY